MTQTINVIPAPTQDQAPAGHEAAMIALVDGTAAATQAAAVGNQPATEGTPTERPAWLPEKFKTAEEMAASYAALEAKLSGRPSEPATTPDPAATTPDPAAVPVEAQAAITKAGLDLPSLEAEYLRDGAISADNLAKLTAAGLTQQNIDSYIEGRKAVAAAQEAQILSAVPGGAEKYTEMTTWAKANLTPAEIDAYNNAVSSGNVELAKLAVAGLGTRFSASIGNEPNLIGGTTTTVAGDVFESQAQVTAAMMDERYDKDPAYRSKVMDKLGRSNF